MGVSGDELQFGMGISCFDLGCCFAAGVASFGC